MKYGVLVFIALIAACSGGNDTPPEPDDLESPDDFIFDQRTPNGIKIQTNEATIPALTDIDTWYTETQVCLGMGTTNQPSVVVLDDLDVLCGNGSTGITCTNYDPIIIGLQTAWAEFEFEWKHQFIHYILILNDYPDDLNRNHEPDELWDCQF